MFVRSISHFIPKTEYPRIQIRKFCSTIIPSTPKTDVLESFNEDKTRICPFEKGEVETSYERRDIYNEIISDEIETAKDAVNKAFAYLAVGKSLYKWESFYCFEIAKELDKENKYKNAIDCGMTSVLKGNDEIDCFHAFK